MADIVQQLRRVLPGKTDLFHQVVGVSSITATANLATVITSAAHNLASSRVVALTGVETRIPIVSAAKNGMLTTFTTSADHDLTEGNPDTANVPLFGFTDPLWNADHELVSVENRRSFTVRNALSAPVLNSNELLLEPNRIDGLNGVFEVTVVDTTTFTISGTFIPGTYTPVNGKVVSNPRIYPSVTVERAQKLYEEKDPGEFWAFVIPGQAVVSKSRSTESDATASLMDGEDMRIRLLDEFSVFVFAPSAKELAATKAVDICRHDLLQPIVSSLFGTRVQTGLACDESEFRVTFVGHEIFNYSEAVLTYEYAFQAPMDLTSDDAVVLAADRAFRDIDYAHTGFHTPLTFTADLDEEPL
jgi:hypothetical protein